MPATKNPLSLYVKVEQLLVEAIADLEADLAKQVLDGTPFIVVFRPVGDVEFTYCLHPETGGEGQRAYVGVSDDLDGVYTWDRAGADRVASQVAKLYHVESVRVEHVRDFKAKRLAEHRKNLVHVRTTIAKAQG